MFNHIHFMANFIGVKCDVIKVSLRCHVWRFVYDQFMMSFCDNGHGRDFRAFSTRSRLQAQTFGSVRSYCLTKTRSDLETNGLKYPCFGQIACDKLNLRRLSTSKPKQATDEADDTPCVWRPWTSTEIDHSESYKSYKNCWVFRLTRQLSTFTLLGHQFVIYFMSAQGSILSCWDIWHKGWTSNTTRTDRKVKWS